MAEGRTWFDVASTVLIVVAVFVTVVGAAILVFHRARPIAGRGSALTALWWVVCSLGALAGLILVSRIVFNDGNSGEDRMMQSLLLLVFGPACLSAAIAIFVKPR